jgi:phenylpropionate dioxygenase-like ring-hydroxylating dioxygenase large terminal subunit
MLRLLYVTVLVSWLLLGAVESFLLPQKAVVATRTPQQHHYSLLVLKTTTTTTTISEEEDATTNNTPKALGAWVPVGSASNLKGLDPTRIEIMGRFLVVWQNSDSDTIKWNVAMDECPHRMAPLSQGRINPQTNCLECPYHGWQFHGNGTLACIPQEEEARRPIITKNHNSNFGRLESFPTHSTGDLIWAFLPTTWHGESFPISLLPEDYYQGLAATKKSLFDVVNLPYSWEFLVENGLDGPHHATFAHHGVGFDRAEVTPLTFQVPINNATHLAVEVKYQRKGLERQ